MNISSTLVEIELNRHDWKRLKTCVGDATNIPNSFRKLLAAANEKIAYDSYWEIDNFSILQGGISESAAKLIPAIYAALIDKTRQQFVKDKLLELLFQIYNGFDSPFSDEIKTLVREGMWVLYEYLPNFDAINILERLEIVPEKNVFLQSIKKLHYPQHVRSTGVADIL